MKSMHCKLEMTCLGWTAKRNGHKVHWCEICGAVLVQRLINGRVISSEPLRIPLKGQNDEPSIQLASTQQ